MSKKNCVLTKEGQKKVEDILQGKFHSVLEMAEKTKLSRDTINRLRKGNEVNLSTINKLCDFFKKREYTYRGKTIKNNHGNLELNLDIDYKILQKQKQKTNQKEFDKDSASLNSQQRDLEDEQSGNSSPRHNIPSSTDIGTCFVGREQKLEDLHVLLSNDEICVIRGMGGIGKTELATRYCLSHLQSHSYPGGILWIRARDSDIGRQIIDFAKIYLNLHPPEDLRLEQKVRWCWNRWTKGNTLVVLDDINSRSCIYPYLPPQLSQFKVLITTRLKLEDYKNIFLEHLLETDALSLLAQLIGEEKQNQELAQAKEVCKFLGYLPLALQLIGKHVKILNKSLAELLLKLKEQGLAHDSLVVEEDNSNQILEDPDRILKPQRGVAAVFELSWSELSEDAQQLGFLLSLFALAPIPWSLVERAAVGQDKEKLEKARVQLENMHLLMGKENYPIYELHQLIRQYLINKRKCLDTMSVQNNFCQVMLEVAEEIHEEPIQKIVSSAKYVIPHLAELAQNLPDQISNKNLIQLLVKLAKFSKKQGSYAEAQFWFEKCVSEVKSRFGAEDCMYAISLNNLANICEFQGRYQDAEQYYKQALELDTKIQRKKAPNYVTSLNGLANIYLCQGRYKDAEPFCNQALKLTKKVLGKEHPDVATSLSRFANLYLCQGRYKEAEIFCNQALELDKKMVREEHADYAISLNILAKIYYYQRRYQKAEDLYKQALELTKKVLGEEHPDVATSWYNLANLYCYQERYEEAEKLHNQALKLRLEILGEEHPEVANSWSGLANLHCCQGHYEEAEKLHNQALKLRLEMLGEEHPNVATSWYNLANLYHDQNRYEEAKKLYNQAWELRSKMLGTEHSDTIIVRERLKIL